jgi:uncharacterized membrane protein
VPLAFAASSWLFLLIAAPLLPAIVAAGIYMTGALICHQIPERSFHIGAAQLPVCARCIGIYTGVAIATWYAVYRAAATWKYVSPAVVLSIGAAPVAMTVLFEWAALWQPSNAVRGLSGLTFGVAVGLILADAAATLHYERCARRPSAELNPPAPPI